MKCDTTKNEHRVKQGKLIVRLRQVIGTLIYKLSYLTQGKKNQNRSEKRSSDFWTDAGICEKCVRHIPHVILIWFCMFSPAEASEIPQAQAIRAIVGEAENQGLEGMTAIAEAIRNRGHLKGVYGCRRNLTATPKWVFSQAEKAWKASENSNLVAGADHWENVDAFGMPYWAKKMKVTAKVKDHTFFREV